MSEKPTPTPAELELLKILWEHGPSSVRTVYEHLSKEKKVAYNTVQTLMRLMEPKGLVRHHTEGRTFIYTACYSRDDTTARFLDRVFDGAAAQLVQSLLQSESISEEELERIQELIAQARLKQPPQQKGGRK